MSLIVMYDSASNGQFPLNGNAYASYVDGHVGDQPNYDWAARAFPLADHLSVSVFGNDADCLDIESGAATVASAAAWFARQEARGLARPCFYASASLMENDLIPAMNAAGIARSSVRLWSAHYTFRPHICGPSSCGALSIAADGTQWTDHVGNLNADESLLLPDFFGTVPVIPPAILTQAEMNAIMNSLPVLAQGAKDHPGAVYFVSRMQALVSLIGKINALPGTQVAADGDFGPATAGAVRAAQKMFGLSQDGVCGPLTWEALVTGGIS